MKRRLRNLPLRTKIALFTSVMLGVSLFILTFITIKLEEAYSKKDLEEQANILLLTLPYSMRDELYFVELDELKEVTRKIGESENITRFVIYDRDGVMLADSNDAELVLLQAPAPFGLELIALSADQEKIYWENSYLIAGRAVFLEAEQIGAVSITLSTDDLEKRTSAIINQSISISLFILLAGVLLSFLLTREFSRPLRALIQVANEMAGGKENIRVHVVATDEIGELGLAFNDMAEAIQTRERDLKELTASLEQKVEKRTEELHQRNAELIQMATTDPLTQINNRRRFFELAEKEYERAKRYQHPLSLILCDADHFKEVNDTYGHQIGDALLIKLADFLAKNIRSIDVVARYGGEEFILLMPEIGHEEAANTAERLRQTIAGMQIAEADQKIPLTVSFGVACWDSISQDLSLDALLYRADMALYQAKKDGRNCVAIWHDPLTK